MVKMKYESSESGEVYEFEVDEGKATKIETIQNLPYLAVQSYEFNGLTKKISEEEGEYIRLLAKPGFKEFERV